MGAAGMEPRLQSPTGFFGSLYSMSRHRRKAGLWLVYTNLSWRSQPVKAINSFLLIVPFVERWVSQLNCDGLAAHKPDAQAKQPGYFRSRVRLGLHIRAP
jgi:hypothetical protein